MGVYLHYQAMPGDSRLFLRLRVEQPLRVMYALLVHQPAGPYDADLLSPDEFDSHLAWIADDPVFGSRPAADRVYADLRAELDQAAEAYPGLRGRAAYLKLRDFDQPLARTLARAGRSDAEALAERLIMGADRLAPDGSATDDEVLRLVTPPLVAEAATLLRGAGAEAFQDPEDYEDEWAAFRSVYVEAAARSEAIVIA